MRADDSAGIDTVWMVSVRPMCFSPPATWLFRCFSRSRSSGARAVDHLSTHVYRGDRGANLAISTRGRRGGSICWHCCTSLAYAFVSFTVLIRPLVKNAN